MTVTVTVSLSDRRTLSDPARIGPQPLTAAAARPAGKDSSTVGNGQPSIDPDTQHSGSHTDTPGPGAPPRPAAARGGLAESDRDCGRDVTAASLLDAGQQWRRRRPGFRYCPCAESLHLVTVIM